MIGLLAFWVMIAASQVMVLLAVLQHKSSHAYLAALFVVPISLYLGIFPALLFIPLSYPLSYGVAGYLLAKKRQKPALLLLVFPWVSIAVYLLVVYLRRGAGGS